MKMAHMLQGRRVQACFFPLGVAAGRQRADKGGGQWEGVTAERQRVCGTAAAERG